VEEALQRLKDGWSPYVLDVRLPQEAEIVSLPFANRLCPHREVTRWVVVVVVVVVGKIGGGGSKNNERL